MNGDSERVLDFDCPCARDFVWDDEVDGFERGCRCGLELIGYGDV